MSKIRVLIIDDEYLAREIIESFLLKMEDVEIIGTCDNGFEGFKLINELNPDLIFLDVMMPKLTGFEMLELLTNPPAIIFSTAYDEYAIKAFEKSAVDYLLKPYSEARFVEAVAKAKLKIGAQALNSDEPLKNLSTNFQQNETLSRIAVKTGSKIHLIAVDKIKYVESFDDYVKIHTADGQFIKQQTMKYYETNLPEKDFARIHRSYIVKVGEIARLELMGKDSHIAQLHDGKQLPVSRSGYAKLKEVLHL
jgi:two-component system, LytTR family, response regulator